MSNSEYHCNSTQYQNTDTNMLVHLLANSDKLKSEEKRWQYNGEKNPELDDDHTNYTKNNNESEKKMEYNHSETYNNTQTDNKTDNKTENKTANSDSYKENKKNTDDENLTQEELFLRKLDMLRKLSELAQAGVKLSQNYNMNSDYKIMKYEYELHKGIRAKQNGINWMSSMTLNMIYGIEMLNEKYNPFDLKLKNWSEQMSADINNYYDVFGELYEKYNQPGKNMAPELKILLMVSGSALKFHLLNTTIGNLPKLNTDLEEDPVLAEQLRQKAIAQKLKEQTIKNNETLKSTINKEHEQATQKAQDLNLIRQKELEYQNLKRENAQKSAEVESLREKLLMTKTQQNTQINSQYTNSNIAQSNTNQNIPQQNLMKMPATVQRMMMARQMQQQNQQQNQEQFKEQLNQQYGLANNNLVSNQINKLKAQTDYMEELERIKNIRLQEEKKLQTINEKNQDSESFTESSNTSKSSVEYNVNLRTILSDSKKKLQDETSSSSDKITSLGLVEKDEISRSNISLGKKRQKKDKESKDSKETNKSEKSKTVRQKKTGITLN